MYLAIQYPNINIIEMEKPLPRLPCPSAVGQQGEGFFLSRSPLDPNAERKHSRPGYSFHTASVAFNHFLIFCLNHNYWLCTFCTVAWAEAELLSFSFPLS